MRISTAELIKNFGEVADKALKEPVTVTKNGRDRFVLVAAEEFERLKRRDRRVVRIEDFTDADLKLMAEQLSQAGDPALDRELDGWKP